jgi:3-dehydroquinate dehydratase-2
VKIAIINGPNLNLLGRREPGIYGSQDFASYFDSLKKKFPAVAFLYNQSNSEGELIDAIQEYGFSCDGILLNAGGYTHTSVAIADAVAAVPCPVVEIHISHIFAREEERRVSLLSKHCKAMISGLGLAGYEMGVRWMVER